MRAMDKVMKELHAFIAKKAPNGVKSDKVKYISQI